MGELIADVKIKRRDCKNGGTWVDFGHVFDPDWDQSQNTQQLVVVSNHHLAASVSKEFSAKYGLTKDGDDQDTKPDGTGDANGSVKISITSPHSKFRDNNEMSRRQILSSIIGVAETGDIYKDTDGTEWNVKGLGIVKFYFNHYYTDLAD